MEGCGVTVSFSNDCGRHQEAEVAEGIERYLGLAATERTKQSRDREASFTWGSGCHSSLQPAPQDLGEC